MMTTATLKYMFSLSASLPTRMLGKTPAGHRFDVEYRSSESQSVAHVESDPIRILSDWGADLLAWLRADPARPAAVKVAKPGWQDPPSTLWSDIAAGKPFGDQRTGDAVFLSDLVVGRGRPPVAERVDRAVLDADLSKVEQDLLANPSPELAATAQKLGALKTRLTAYAALAAEAEAFLDLVRDYCLEYGIPQPWLGLNGYILSGVDWALLRSDGVIEFDGQLVLKDGPRDDQARGVLVNARTSGAVDLVSKGFERPYSLDHALELWMMEATVPVALSFKFEAPQEPEPWASKKYTRRRGQLRYAQLSRGQFVGCGEIKTNNAQAASVELAVFQVVPTSSLKTTLVPDDQKGAISAVLKRLRSFEDGGRFE